MPPSPKPITPKTVILTGNPNCGKTTLFNALTGLRAKVGNYAGVTVERKEGRLTGAPAHCPITLLDLPGTYSLSPQSLDEQISRDVLFHRVKEVPAPDLVVVVVDASNLERNLYYATQVLELGYPVVLVLNMVDVAADNGVEIDVKALSRELQAPVVPMVASTGKGVLELKNTIVDLSLNPPPGKPAVKSFCCLPDPLLREMHAIAELLKGARTHFDFQPESEALLLLTDQKTLAGSALASLEPVQQAIKASRERLEQAGVEWSSIVIESRYACAAAIHNAVAITPALSQETFSDKLDRLLTHRVWGVLVFGVLMVIMFQSIFTFAKLPMHALDAGVSWIGEMVGSVLPPGDLHSLLVDGVIAGVGAVVVFLPQICLLFLFIGLLEDTGYMARAAFIMDRLMSKVGLHGKSFIPMLSSFACAIPGIMATRTIEGQKDRLVTILVAPLMSCSARLPVYTLLIAACIPDTRLFGLFRLQGLTLFGMYLLGVIGALSMAWLFKKTLLKGDPPMMVMELPSYKRPALKEVARHVWERSALFLKKAGTVILGINILLWFFASYPRYSPPSPSVAAPSIAQPGASETGRQHAAIDSKSAPAARFEPPGEQLKHSYAGMLGRLIEPAIAPLGFDWKIGIGIVTSFAAREVFVSTMSTVYSVAASESADAQQASLARNMQAQTRPDGSPMYTPLTGITLMVFYVFALQCVSTIAIVRRETNSWRWPLFQWVYMGALAWGLAFITYNGGRLMGWQ
jgi:ferrous iron transport protein B